MITEDGIKPAAKYTASINDFPTPSIISEMRAWYRLVNQVAYCFCKTDMMAMFRHLLSPVTPFVWTGDLETAFSASMDTILEMIIRRVHLFDSELETYLSTDDSKEGMGWILQQKTCTCKKVSPTCCPDGWNHVLTGGAFCKPEERNYSEIEGAATAILKGLQDGMGCKKLHMATDHQPLVTTLGKQSAMTSNKLMETCATEIALWSTPLTKGSWALLGGQFSGLGSTRTSSRQEVDA